MNEEMNNVVKEAVVEPTMDLVEATVSKSGKGAAEVALVVAGVFTIGALIVGGVKFGINKYNEHQSKKELRKPETVVEPTQEQLDEATK